MNPSFFAAPWATFRTTQRGFTALRLAAVCAAMLLFLHGAREGRRLLVLSQAAATERRTQLEGTLQHDRQPAGRQRAAAALGQLGDTDALPALIIALLGDRDASVRAASADALAALADLAALPALRAATHDEEALVRQKAALALTKLAPPDSTTSKPNEDNSPLKSHVTIVVGRMGSKATSGTMPNIPQRLREAVVKEIRNVAEIDLVDDRNPGEAKSGYSVDSSVTKLARRTTPAGELEISCDVSMIIAVMPGRSVVGMVSGGASVIGPRGPSTRPTKAYLESLESEALTQAVKETHASLMNFLRHQVRGARP